MVAKYEVAEVYYDDREANCYIAVMVCYDKGRCAPQWYRKTLVTSEELGTDCYASLPILAWMLEKGWYIVARYQGLFTLQREIVDDPDTDDEPIGPDDVPDDGRIHAP